MAVMVSSPERPRVTLPEIRSRFVKYEWGLSSWIRTDMAAFRMTRSFSSVNQTQKKREAFVKLEFMTNA